MQIDVLTCAFWFNCGYWLHSSASESIILLQNATHNIASSAMLYWGMNTDT